MIVKIEKFSSIENKCADSDCWHYHYHHERDRLEPFNGYSLKRINSVTITTWSKTYGGLKYNFSDY